MQIKGPEFVGISTFITWIDNNKHVQTLYTSKFLFLTLSTRSKNFCCFDLSLHKSIIFPIAIYHHVSQYKQNVHVSSKGTGKSLWDSFDDNNMLYTLCTIHNYAHKSIFQYPQPQIRFDFKFGSNACILYAFLFAFDFTVINPSLLKWILINK